jgi:hypothetical protein
MSDLVTLDGIRYRITDRQLVRYDLPETAAERKLRGAKPQPVVAYTIATIERVRDE